MSESIPVVAVVTLRYAIVFAVPPTTPLPLMFTVLKLTAEEATVSLLIPIKLLGTVIAVPVISVPRLIKLLNTLEVLPIKLIPITVAVPLVSGAPSAATLLYAIVAFNKVFVEPDTVIPLTITLPAAEPLPRVLMVLLFTTWEPMVKVLNDMPCTDAFTPVFALGVNEERLRTIFPVIVLTPDVE